MLRKAVHSDYYEKIGQAGSRSDKMATHLGMVPPVITVHGSRAPDELTLPRPLHRNLAPGHHLLWRHWFNYLPLGTGKSGTLSRL